MNEKLEIFLESSSTAWDNFKGSGQPVRITLFTDPIGGIWDVANRLAPCGGGFENRGNPYRQYCFCERHPAEGILINLYKDNGWYWLSGKEVNKK